MSKKQKFKSIYEVQDKVPDYVWENIERFFAEHGRERYREGVKDGEENIRSTFRDLLDVKSRYDK